VRVLKTLNAVGDASTRLVSQFLSELGGGGGGGGGCAVLLDVRADMYRIGERR
jgi:hypothetical protein